MSNPLYNQMNQNNLISQFNQFKRTFNGNPQQKVQELLNTGKISQAQYNKAEQMANQFSGLLKMM